MINPIRYCLLFVVVAFVAGYGPVGVCAQTAQGQQNPHAQQDTQVQQDPDAQQDTHDHRNITPRVNFLSEPAREVLKRLMVQDFRGRMKPLDTLTRESLWKVSKKGSLEGWDPLDLYLSWMAHPDYWFERPIIAVRNPQLRSMLGVRPGEKRVSPASLYDEAGQYSLIEQVEEAQRTPDKLKSKMQRKLISLDERFNVFFMTIRGITLRVFPLPEDENNRWLAVSDLQDEPMPDDVRQEYQTAFNALFHGLQDQDSQAVLQAARTIEAFQVEHGAEVLPSKTALNAEMQLNRFQPFIWATIPYIIAFALLVLAYAMSLFRHHIAAISFRNPAYALGMLVFVATLLFHAWGYVLRWIASGRAPLSNGYESLVFIALMIGVVGLYYELRSRRASMAALSALLTSVILGVAMLPTFDAAITPLVPVLSSYWLIIHVTIITASYGYLGLSAVIALTMLVLHLFKRPGRMTLQLAIHELNRLNWNVMFTGLAFLSVGTFLGGVWANESWGRYWGWDPKETWALVTILVYAFIAHFRFVDSLNRPINLAAGCFLGISSVGMTYFGVNYFLSGLHSYAQGDAPGVPGWVYIMAAVMMALVFAAYLVDASQSWEGPERPTRPKGKGKAVSPAT